MIIIYFNSTSNESLLCIPTQLIKEKISILGTFCLFWYDLFVILWQRDQSVMLNTFCYLNEQELQKQLTLEPPPPTYKKELWLLWNHQDFGELLNRRCQI